MTDINVGAITETLTEKSDLDLGNTSPQLVDYIVEQQLPSADNNYTWYDLYKSGKVRQGGTVQLNASSITLPVKMKDDNYDVVLHYYKETSSTTNIAIGYTTGSNLQPTSFTILPSALKRNWLVEGMSAN